MAIERLAYETLESDGPFQVRRIRPHVVAETLVEGGFETVGNVGFRRLVAYISGENRTRESFAMTTPVGQARPSQKLAMTAPVGQARIGDRYRITFLMPQALSLDELPEPLDARVRLVEEPARTVAAIRYRGFWTRSRYDEHEQRLRDWMGKRGLAAAGAPEWARYHPPFMPWFLRRNEIWIECSTTSARSPYRSRDQPVV